MSWTLSVSARKREFADAATNAEPVSASSAELGDADREQAAMVAGLAVELVGTFEVDSGMVGLSANGAVGAQGLVAFSLSVASQADETLEPQAQAEPSEIEEARQAGGSRYARGERPEAPGVVDEEANRVAAEAVENDPTREHYRPDLEPDEAPHAPTSLGEDAKRAADAKAPAKGKAAKA